MIVSIAFTRLLSPTKGNCKRRLKLQRKEKSLDGQLTNTDRALESAIMELLSRRAAGKTICPSEAARMVDPTGWEELMERSRAAARRLVAQGAIVITQQGSVVEPSSAKGAIRLRRV
jgi:hypothetical protein